MGKWRLRSNGNSSGSEIVTLIGEGTVFTGELVLTGGARVDGRVVGRVSAGSLLVVGPTGDIEAEELRANSVTVCGNLRGRLLVQDQLEIQPGGRVCGQVVMEREGLVIAPGGVFEGTVEYVNEGTSDETGWSDPKSQADDWYRLSKTLAERAAWDFMRAEGGATEFATVLPAAIFGSILGKESRSSVTIIERMIEGKLPGVPNFGVCVVDVRDVADLHLRAMTAPEAVGERFIASGRFMWMREIAEALRTGLGARGDKVPVKRLPDLAIRAGALFNPQLKAMAKLLGRLVRYSSAKAERVLGWKTRREEDTVVECAESLLT